MNAHPSSLSDRELETLRDVVRCLRETGRYVDEEGEATNALEDLAQTLGAQTPPRQLSNDYVIRRFAAGVNSTAK